MKTALSSEYLPVRGQIMEVTVCDLQSGPQNGRQETPVRLHGTGRRHALERSALSQKNYGYARWSDLMRATEYFEETSGDNHQPSFRIKKTGTAPEAK